MSGIWLRPNGKSHLFRFTVSDKGTKPPKFHEQTFIFKKSKLVNFFLCL